MSDKDAGDLSATNRACRLSGSWNLENDMTHRQAGSTIRLLKTYLFARYYACSALEVNNFRRYIDVLTYLLTYTPQQTASRPIR